MTRQRSFKRLVRSRMEKTGESYTAARAALLDAEEPGGTQAVLITSDETIRNRTGRGWEEWFDLLDDWGADSRSHRDIARWVAEQLGLEPLAWDAQAVTVSYERARGGRAVGQRVEGFAVTVTRTVAVPVERLFEALVDPQVRESWLPGGVLRERTSQRPRTARFDYDDGATRVNVGFTATGEAKSQVALAHERLPDAAAAEEAKVFWRERLTDLKVLLEGTS
jgi:hypothetical protein